MKYEPVKFWKGRNVPSEGIEDYLEAYIKKHIKGAGNVLDFGVGTGRLLPLYGDRHVDMFDLIKRMDGVKTDLSDLWQYDVTVVSKVFLHIPPEDIDRYVKKILRISKKVIVYDANVELTAVHTFNHDFTKWGEMKDVETHGDHLLFVYDNS